MTEPLRRGGRYAQLIERIFLDRFESGSVEVPFKREDIVEAARILGIALPKNLGDVIYAMRYRNELPASVRESEAGGKHWVIQGRGRAEYAFRLVSVADVAPNPSMLEIKIPDATPELVGAYALTDEQALLARVRYNRLVDVFLGVTAYSLQNHLRTTVVGVGQVEIDEIYAGVDRKGCQYIVPVQAKGGADKLSSVQTAQDIACCAEKYPALQCRAVCAQFMPDDVIALFELCEADGEVKIVAEQHYRLVPAESISPEDLARYSR
ncbi:MAG: endonuclease [Planctomycetota bacterium]|nr:MAG: endonuclease [Planctomycetota bacterium]